MIKEFFNSYVEARNALNPYRETTSWKWKKAYRLSMQEFSTLVSKLSYESDPLFGVIDYTGDMDRFFEDVKVGRDCDNYARAWLYWGVHNGYHGHEMIVSTMKHPFSDAHVVTVLEKCGCFYLCNYDYYGPFNSLELALDDLKRWERYADGYIHAKGIYKEAL